MADRHIASVQSGLLEGTWQGVPNWGEWCFFAGTLSNPVNGATFTMNETHASGRLQRRPRISDWQNGVVGLVKEGYAKVGTVPTAGSVITRPWMLAIGSV